MAQDENPLKSLIDEENQDLDLDQLTNLLAGRISFSKEGEMQTRTDFYDMSNQQKVLLLLLGAKAKSILFDAPDGLAPSEIIERDVMPAGSVKSSLKSLLEDTHEIKKSSDKRYYVPNYMITKLQARFTKDEK